MELYAPMNPDLARGPVALAQAPSKYIQSLEARGYRWIRLSGLNRLKATYAGGAPCQELPVPVDPDAEFLLSYYRHLEDIVERRASALHLTYVCDGLFEFNAFITPEGVRVRAGIFRDEAFVPPYTAGVLVETRTYLDMWRSAAAAIVNAWP